MKTITPRVRTMLAKRIARAKAAILLFDFDGTLVPFARDAGSLYLPARTRRSLENLGRRHQIGIISGRSLADIHPRIGISSFWYAGNHGLEWLIDGVRGGVRVPLRERKALRATVRDLGTIAKLFPGMTLEDKGATLIVRFGKVRRAKRAEAVAAIRGVLAPHIAASTLAVREKPIDMDIRPHTDWHKGSVARLMAERIGENGASPLVLFIGDDTTDEDAFRTLTEGVTIRVGCTGPSGARYCLPSRRDVAPFLAALIRATP